MVLSRCLLSLFLVSIITAASAAPKRNAPYPAGATPKAAVADIIVSGTQTCTRVDINVQGEVTGTVDQGGGMDFIVIEIWDDGELKDSAQVDVPVGDVISFDEALGFLGAYLTDADGVGVYVTDSNGATLFDEDPFIPANFCHTHTAPVVVPASSTTQLALLALLAALGGLLVLRRRH